MIKITDINREFKCKISDTEVTGRIQVEDNSIYLCQNEKNGFRCSNKLGYLYSWSVESGSDSDLFNNGITDFIFLDELSSGWNESVVIINIITNEEGIIIFSKPPLIIYKYRNNDNIYVASRNYTIDELKSEGWKIK